MAGGEKSVSPTDMRQTRLKNKYVICEKQRIFGSPGSLLSLCFREHFVTMETEKREAYVDKKITWHRGKCGGTDSGYICDSDDWVDFDMYRLMYEKAKADDADVVSCGYIVHDGDRHLRQMKETPKVLKEDAIKQMMLQQTHWVLWNKLFKRSLYNNPLIYPTENMGEDMALSLQLMYYCNKMSYIDDDLYYYFYNRESLTNTKDEIASLKRFSQTHRNCELVYDFYSSKGDFKVYKKALEWLRMVVKMHIDKSTHKGKILWKSTYFHVEFKLLFNPLITNEQRKIVLRKILRR